MNKAGPVVREHARSAPTGSADDRRVRRTQEALIFALINLVVEKRYDAITIQDLLDRADVGRSTFYSHFRGKDDLLLRSWERLLETLDSDMYRRREGGESARRRVAPVRELFHHVAKMKPFHQALARAHMLDRVYQVGVNQLSRTIARRLGAMPPATASGAVPTPVTAQAYAGALFALLRWWVDHDGPYTPERMDEMYHATCRPT
jgi:AcrR family transcriptional regulator